MNGDKLARLNEIIKTIRNENVNKDKLMSHKVLRGPAFENHGELESDCEFESGSEFEFDRINDSEEAREAESYRFRENEKKFSAFIA